MSFGIWNNIDEAGLYLNLERLENETDESFHRRLKKFGQWKFKTDYYTQTHSIPLQVGLDTKNLMELNCTKRFVAHLDWEYFTAESFNEDGTSSEYIRVFINTPSCTLSKIVDLIDSSTDFTMTVFNSTYLDYKFKNIIRATNTFLQTDQIDSKNSNLRRGNLIKGTLRASNTFVINREVSSLQDLLRNGDYFIDLKRGYIESFSVPESEIDITYRYYNPRFIIEYTDINLIPLNVMAKYGVTDDLINLMPYLLAKQTWGN